MFVEKLNDWIDKIWEAKKLYEINNNVKEFYCDDLRGYLHKTRVRVAASPPKAYMYERMRATIISFASMIFVMILCAFLFISYMCSVAGDEWFRLWKKVSESNEEGDDLHQTL